MHETITPPARERKVEVFSSMLYVDLRLAGDANFAIPDEHEDRAIYVADGRIALDDTRFTPGNMIVLERGAPAKIRANIIPPGPPK